MLQAVVFDFDGVLADSEPLHLRAYQTVLGREGIELTRDDYYEKYLGFDDRGLFCALSEDKGLSAADDRVDAWIDSKSRLIEEMLADGSVLFPGADACVRMLAHRFPIAIASGALQPEIELVLRSSGLADCFKTIASASDGVRGKPAPDLYLLALAKLRTFASVDARSCVAIEDSHWGLESARAAGLRTVAVTHTYPAAELAPADLIVERLSDISVSKLEALWG